MLRATSAGATVLASFSTETCTLSPTLIKRTVNKGQPREETWFFIRRRIGVEVDVVHAEAAVKVVDMDLRQIQRATNTGPGAVKVGSKAEDRVAVTVGDHADAAWRIEGLTGQQRHRTTLLGAARQIGQHLI